MTDERKNEIWAMLTEEEKKDIQRRYGFSASLFDSGYNSALDRLFGRHNLTAQAEEKPKDESDESKYAVDDKVFVKTSRNLASRDMDIFRRNPSYVQGIKDGMVTVAVSIQHSATIPVEDIVPWVDGNEEFISSNAHNCENFTENGISDSKIQPESAESVETSTKDDAYFAYRLDLAKEIAVAMVAAGWEAGDIPRDAVDDANEIVKRLKETEE